MMQFVETGERAALETESCDPCGIAAKPEPTQISSDKNMIIGIGRKLSRISAALESGNCYPFRDRLAATVGRCNPGYKLLGEAGVAQKCSKIVAPRRFLQFHPQLNNQSQRDDVLG